MKLSVVIPCLNESDTVAKCVTTALATMAKIDIEGEAIVADNGSADGSQKIASASADQEHRFFCRLFGAISK